MDLRTVTAVEGNILVHRTHGMAYKDPQRPTASYKSSGVDLPPMRALLSLNAKSPKRSLSGAHDLNSPPNRERNQEVVEHVSSNCSALDINQNQCIEIRA